MANQRSARHRRSKSPGIRCLAAAPLLSQCPEVSCQICAPPETGEEGVRGTSGGILGRTKSRDRTGD